MSADVDATAPSAAALMDSVEFWRSFAESVPDMLLLVDREATILYVNRAPDGMRRDDVLGTSALNYVPATSRVELRASLDEIFRGAPARLREQAGIHIDGTMRWYATHTGPVVRNGSVVAAIVAARDITASKRAQIALAESEARYSTLVEHAPEAIVVFDMDRRTFVDGNQNACTLFGVTLDALLTSDPVALSPHVQPNGVPSLIAVQRNLDEALSGRIPCFEWMHRTQDGRDVLCEVRLARLPSSERRLVRGSIIDVTERRRAEQQMQEWQKMDALGQLAAGIAHDFNNVLCVISAAAHTIATAPDVAAENRTDAEAIQAEVQRGAALTLQLLTFAKRQSNPAEVVELNDVVRAIASTLRRVIERRVEIVVDLDEEGALVPLSRSQLEQVVMNLVLNSRDAVSGAGAITLVTSRRGSMVLLLVKDTGCGMSADVRSHVLEPFFTTKAQTGGSGLGLSMVRTIVSRVGGAIEIESAVGVGTSIAITLPVSQTS